MNLEHFNTVKNELKGNRQAKIVVIFTKFLNALNSQTTKLSETVDLDELEQQDDYDYQLQTMILNNF